jgi:alkyldihydroxyacetonephosphate synthase
MGLEVVLASGEVMQIPAVPKASTGPMLRHLFIGAEGVFGIITRVDMRLFPIPEQRAIVGYLYRRFEDGLAATMEMMDLQLRPMMIDYEEDEPWDEEPAVGKLVPRESPMYLAFDGFREEVAANVARVDELCRRHGGEPAHEAAHHFWEHRHDSAYRWVEQLRTDPDSLGINRATRRWTSTYINVCLPASQVQPYRERAATELAAYRLVVKDAGLWGVPELLSVRFEHQDPESPEAPAELDAGTDLGLRLAHELGGSMEYCHGVGLRLAHMMESEWGAGLGALHALKRALDPQGLLNPGKLGL